MKLDHALATLKNAEVHLRTKGVMHAGVFGSVARGDARPDSDVDILVKFDPAARVSIYDYVGVQKDIASLFKVKVDVIDRDGLKPHLREPVARDLVHAF
jgi:predicted nucleotidyltransferase